MKTRFLSLLAFVLLFSCTRELAPIQESPVAETAEPQAIVSGEIIVKFTEDMTSLVEADLSEADVVTKSSELTFLNSELGIRSMERLFPHAGEFEERTRAEGLHRWYKVKYDKEIPLTKASDGFNALPGVEIVEPVRNIKLTSYFNDPKLKDQWHYKNDGGMDGFKAGADINVEPVWKDYTTGNRDVIVAIVDGGIDYEHEDLKDAYVGGKSFCDDQPRVVPHSHGTHVAGTVGAINNNGKGVAGVAGGDAKKGIKGVGLLSCQIFAPDPDDPQVDLGGDGAAAIKWGADNGAVISQNSWGYRYQTAEEAAAAVIPAYLAAAIDYFIKYAGCDASGKQVGPMKGGVVIFAAGNDAFPADPIGKYDPVISVGAMSSNMSRTDYSNYGDWVDLAAPGGGNGGLVISTLPGNSYGGNAGTSMACPHVSGIAALVVSHFGGPGFTNETLRNKLINGANKTALSKNAKIGYLVDALGAITYGGTVPPAAVSSFTAAARSNNISFEWTVTSDPDDKKAYGFLLLASKDKSLLTNIDLKNIPSEVATATVMTGEMRVGDAISGSVSGLDFDQEYYVALAAFDYNRNWSKLSAVKTLRTEGNNVPEISTSYTGDFKVKSHVTFKASYNISDPDGHEFKVKFTSGSAAAAFTQNPDGTWQLVIVGNADKPGKYQAKVIVTDKYDASVEKIIDYELLPNHAPIIVKDIEDKMFTSVGSQFSLEMDEYLEDPDGEQLKFAITISNNKTLHINPKDNVLHATVLSYGKADVSITASDSRGETCVLTFTVLVKDPSKPLEMYPNPVSDFLNVSTLEPAQTRIVISSSTGQVMYDETSSVSAIDPARIDMSSYAPGVYSVNVNFSGNEYKRTVIKL